MIMHAPINGEVRIIHMKFKMKNFLKGTNYVSYYVVVYTTHLKHLSLQKIFYENFFLKRIAFSQEYF